MALHIIKDNNTSLWSLTQDYTESKSGWGWQGPPEVSCSNPVQGAQVALEGLQGRSHGLTGQPLGSITCTVKECFLVFTVLQSVPRVFKDIDEIPSETPHQGPLH